MLSSEAAEKRLKEFAAPQQEQVARKLARIENLPEALRATAYALMDRDENGKPLAHRWDAKTQKKREETLTAAQEHLDRMSIPERETVFAALATEEPSPA